MFKSLNINLNQCFVWFLLRENKTLYLHTSDCKKDLEYFDILYLLKKFKNLVASIVPDGRSICSKNANCCMFAASSTG